MRVVSSQRKFYDRKAPMITSGNISGISIKKKQFILDRNLTSMHSLTIVLKLKILSFVLPVTINVWSIVHL